MGVQAGGGEVAEELKWRVGGGRGGQGEGKKERGVSGVFRQHGASCPGQPGITHPHATQGSAGERGACFYDPHRYGWPIGEGKLERTNI